LSRNFPPWETVYCWFRRRWRNDGTWEKLNAALRERLRARSGRNPLPSAGIDNSQSAKTTGVGGEQRRYHRGKKVQGRKRHLLVDTEGLVVKAKVNCAKVPDQDGLRLLLESARSGLLHLRHLFSWRPSRREGERDGLRKGMGLRVEVVPKPAKPVPEKVVKVWVQEWVKEKTRRSIGRGSCSSEASRSNWTRPSSATLASENTPSPTSGK